MAFYEYIRRTRPTLIAETERKRNVLITYTSAYRYLVYLCKYRYINIEPGVIKVVKIAFFVRIFLLFFFLGTKHRKSITDSSAKKNLL